MHPNLCRAAVEFYYTLLVRDCSNAKEEQSARELRDSFIQDKTPYDEVLQEISFFLYYTK